VGRQNALLNLEGITEAEVDIVWDPPWHPSMMADIGRRMTGAGIFNHQPQPKQKQ